MSEPEIPDQPSFRIGEVAALVGVEAHVLRYWEQEFGVHPARGPSGTRRYGRDDVASFLRIRDLLHHRGFTIQGARRALEGGDVAEPVDVDRVRAAREGVDEALAAVARVRARLAAAWSPHLLDAAGVDEGRQRA